jgi:pilus assembly protein FimV
MKLAVICGLALVCSSVASAQTPATPASADSARTITMTGCVGGGQNAQPITLANAMVIPTGQNAAATPSPVPDAASSGATQPTGAAAGVGTAGTGSAGVGAPPPTGATSAGVGTAGAAGTTGAAGTAGTAGTAGATGTAGVAGTAGATPTAGASAQVAGTAPAGSSASSLSGYRLSGTDMTAWIGKRVQIVGTVVPSTPGAASPTAAAGAPSAPAFPEFRVMSVQPTTGDCPQK